MRFSVKLPVTWNFSHIISANSGEIVPNAVSVRTYITFVPPNGRFGLSRRDQWR